MTQYKNIIAFFVLVIALLVSTPFYANELTNNDDTGSYFWENIDYYLSFPFTWLFPHLEQRKTIYAVKSDNFDIRVEVDEKGLRHLVFLPRKGSQSIFDPQHPDKIISNFIKASFLVLPALGRAPKKVLFLGLGGGIMPMFIRRHYPKAQIDIIEIEKIIPKIAEKYFGFKPDSKMKVHILDGLEYLERSKEKYDIIFVDVYDAEKVPKQFTTWDFYTLVKEHLTKGGVFTANLADLGEKNFIDSQLNIISQVFPNTFVFVCKGKTNYIPISSTGNVTFAELQRNAGLLDRQKRLNLDFARLLGFAMDKK